MRHSSMATALAAAAWFCSVPAAAQSDPRPEAHATITSVIAGRTAAAQTALGVVPNGVTFWVPSSTGCRTEILKNFRRVNGRRGYVPGNQVTEVIYWVDVVEVVPVDISGNPNPATGVMLRLRNGTKFVWDIGSYHDAVRLRHAMETLQLACAPRPPAPAPTPSPSPQPAPRPQPQPAAPAPTTGFFWIDRPQWCASYAVKGLNLLPSAHATVQRAARGSDNSNRLILSQPLVLGTGPKGPMSNSFIVQSRSGPTRARVASISFDGRPSGIKPDLIDNAYDTSTQRIVYLPADFLDRITGVSTVTLTLSRANGSLVDSYTFDVADLRRMRFELTRAGWNCSGAR